jgi:hypothetical protein
MASYRLSRRGFRLLGISLLSFIALLIYIRWHDILLAYVEPRLPPLYEKARAKESSLPHYEEYKRKTVKYFLTANHAHSKKSRVTIHERLAHSPSFSRFGLGERHARFCHDGFTRPYHQSIVSISRWLSFMPPSLCETSNFVVA